MSKSIVFISHITEEKDLAIKLKELIENSFLGMIEVFVSSDETSISAGSRWLDNITDSLSNCAVELIICSPKSVTRPWINFEAGAGWVREIPVIPLCHSGMEPVKLPIPLNLLQAAKMSEIPSLKSILPILANAIGSKIPNIDLSNFVEDVKEFERKYILGDNLKKLFSIIGGNILELYKYIDSNPKIEEINLNIGVVSNENLEVMRALEKDALKDYIKIESKFSGTFFYLGKTINGGEVILTIKDIDILREFKDILIK